MKEGWSRDVLLNFMDSGLYEREGKALTNFTYIARRGKRPRTRTDEKTLTILPLQE